MKKTKIVSLVIGLLFVALAVLVLGNAVGWWSFELFFDGWWTMFLIIPGLVSIFTGGLNFGNVCMTAVGVILLLYRQDVIESVWPWLAIAVLAAIGIIVILSALGVKVVNAKCDIHIDGNSRTSTGASDDPHPVFSNVLSGLEMRCTSQELQGAEISTVLGGADIDFSDCGIHQDIKITCSAVLGGIEIKLPEGLRVNIAGSPVLASNECSYRSAAASDAPLVTVECSSVLGGIEIK